MPSLGGSGQYGGSSVSGGTTTSKSGSGYAGESPEAAYQRYLNAVRANATSTVGGTAPLGKVGGVESQSFFELLGIEPPRSEVARFDRWSPEQQALFQTLMTGTAAGMTKPAPTSPDMHVPMTAQEQQYFDLVNALAQSRAASGQPLYDVGPEWAEQYYEQGIKPIYMKEWQDVTLPAIERAYAGPGFYSSARQEATVESGQDLAMELAKIRSGLQYDEELKRREALDRALEQQQAIIQTTGQAGATQRGIEQEKVMSNLQKFLMGEKVQVGTDEKGQPIYSEQPLYNASIQMALTLLGLDPYVWAQESTGGDLGYQTFPQFMGGLGQGLGQGIMMSSDRRLKTDIQYM